MDALLMCGGEGNRLAAEMEKPLYPIAGEPMVDRVRRALAESTVETTYAAVSPNAPETSAHLDRTGTPLIETPGEGYVADLGHALGDSRIEPPVLTVAADLALLSAETVDDVCTAYRERVAETEQAETPPRDPGSTVPSMTVCVPRELKRRLGVTVEEPSVGADHLVPTGLNMVGTATGGDADGDDAPAHLVHVVRRTTAAINVNRLEDAQIAERHTSATDEQA